MWSTSKSKFPPLILVNSMGDSSLSIQLSKLSPFLICMVLPSLLTIDGHSLKINKSINFFATVCVIVMAILEVLLTFNFLITLIFNFYILILLLSKKFWVLFLVENFVFLKMILFFCNFFYLKQLSKFKKDACAWKLSINK